MFLLTDIRVGLRTLAKNPGFTIIAVLALALGIGVNAAVFAIANGVLFRGIPFVSDRILYISTKNPARGRNSDGVSDPDFRDYRSQSKSFNAFGAFRFNVVNVSDKFNTPTRYNLATITANAFSMIGQKPVIGRDFTADDEKPGASPVVILGYGVWENRFGKRPEIIGQEIRINDEAATVIGVMQRDLKFPVDSDMWRPLVPGPNSEKREDRGLSVFAELAPGATQKSAIVEMEGIGRNLEQAFAASNKGVIPVIHTFSEENNDPDTWMLIAALMGAVSFVLLIACANVANLLLARAVDRSREISIRIAIGSGRWRIIRQLLVESVMLSILGGLLGWVIAIVFLRVFDTQVRDQIPAWMNFWMDYRGFAYLAAISIGTGLLFGLVPALKLSRLDLNRSLKDGGWGSSGGLRGKYLSGLLVIVEMALAVVLLSGAGLMIRSFVNIYRVKTGVNEKNVLVMRMFLPQARYPNGPQRIAFHERLKARLDALPGVEASTIANTMPTGGAAQFPFELENGPPSDPEHRPSISLLSIGLDYFRVMDVRILRGRTFNAVDGVEGQPPVVIVNQLFADKFWPGEDAIGKRFRLFAANNPEDWLTVVGIVPAILQNGITARGMRPVIYVPYRQKPMSDMALMARTVVPPSTLAEAFRREVQSVDNDLALYNLRTLEERFAQNYWAQKIFVGLFGFFAGIALTLASIGLYAVIAHSVSQRTQEIGVRMALGASAGEVLRLVFRQGVGQMAIGLGVGLAAAVGLTKALTSLMVDVTSTDPVTLGLVSLVLGTSAILGCLIPAMRAMRVDPVVALRHE